MSCLQETILPQCNNTTSINNNYSWNNISININKNSISSNSFDSIIPQVYITLFIDDKGVKRLKG